MEKRNLGSLSMNRLKITFDIQHQGHAVSVKFPEEDEFLYAAFLHLISTYGGLNAVILNLQLVKMG